MSDNAANEQAHEEAFVNLYTFRNHKREEIGSKRAVPDYIFSMLSYYEIEVEKLFTDVGCEMSVKKKDTARAKDLIRGFNFGYAALIKELGLEATDTAFSTKDATEIVENILAGVVRTSVEQLSINLEDE